MVVTRCRASTKYRGGNASREPMARIPRQQREQQWRDPAPPRGGPAYTTAQYAGGTAPSGAHERRYVRCGGVPGVPPFRFASPSASRGRTASHGAPTRSSSLRQWHLPCPLVLIREARRSGCFWLSPLQRDAFRDDFDCRCDQRPATSRAQPPALGLRVAAPTAAVFAVRTVPRGPLRGGAAVSG